MSYINMSRLRVLIQLRVLAIIIICTSLAFLNSDRVLHNTHKQENILRGLDNKHKLENDLMSKRKPNSSFERISNIEALKIKYKLNSEYLLNGSPWEYPRGWMSKEEVHPEYTAELGAVLRAMATAKIIYADIHHFGFEVKFSITMEGNQRALFKPSRLLNAAIPTSEQHQYNGEIAGFHLGRLLEFRRTPLSVGRILNIETEIKTVASPALSKLFYKIGKNACFMRPLANGIKVRMLCGDGAYMRGAVVLWFPETISLVPCSNPWGMERNYRWFKKSARCTKTPISTDGRLTLDMVDASVLEYLMGNGDRQSCFRLGNDSSSAMAMIDNSIFINPDIDMPSILAPLYQCCRIRESTWLQLQKYVNNTLSTVLQYLLSTDPTSPIMNDQLLRAMDRRLTTIIITVKTCFSKFSPIYVLVKEYKDKQLT